VSGALLPPPSLTAERIAWRGGFAEPGARALPEEAPVALVYGGSTYAVMMATPADLEDFAVGFTLNEGVASLGEIESLDVAPGDDGVELRLWLAEGAGRAHAARRRALAGPTGCGLCGVESLAAANAPAPRVSSQVRLPAAALVAAMEALAARQRLNIETRAVHAAAFFRPERGVGPVREDVGRHNALDKLAGALARSGFGAAEGAALLTSRVSVELVQKAARMGVGVLAAVSAPTGLALRTAEAAGVTLVGVVRSDGLEVFTHPWRIGPLQ
jgi:FdhD protein